MEDIKVSIIVPSYKRHKELFSRAIQSLLNQTYENIEIIVIDDNATPELQEYREELSDYIKELNSSKIIYIQNEHNLGSAKTRDNGIYKATGEYIAFLDDDDKFLPKKIENQVKFMIEKELDVSFTNLIICNQNDKIVDFREFRRLKNFEQQAILKYHLTRKITGTDIFMMKKRVLIDVGGFDCADMGDEFYLMLKIFEKNYKSGYLDDSNVILYREGQESLTVQSNRLGAEKKVFESIKERYQILSFRERCYARFRYNVTKLMTYKRAKKYFKCIGTIFSAFFSSPLSFIIEPIRMKRNLNKVSKLEK